MTIRECIQEQGKLAAMLARRAAEHEAAADVLKMGGHRDDAASRLRHGNECKQLIAMIGETVKHLTAKAKQLGFAPPSLLEVEAEARRIGIPRFAEESQKFMAHYSANGWKVGRVPMKDWKSALVGWRERLFEKHPELRPKTGKHPDSERKLWESFLKEKGMTHTPIGSSAEWQRIEFREWQKTQ